MTGTLTIDKAGRIVLPKPLREELQLEPGDSLEVNIKGEEITLRPIRGNSPLKKKHGVWCFRLASPWPRTWWIRPFAKFAATAKN